MAKRRRKTRRNEPERWWERLRERLAETEWTRARRASQAIITILVVAALTGGWLLGVPRLRAAVAEATATEVSIVFVDEPAWVRGDLLALLDLTARHQLSGDPIAQSDLVAMRSALMNTGWFDAVRQVRRTSGNRIEVHADFVRPAAVIRDDEGDHLVDPTGKVLPRSYETDAAKTQIVITGAHLPRPGLVGTVWPGADVTAALRLLRLLSPQPWRGQVAAIDVSTFRDDESLVIATDRGSRLFWGSAPGAEEGLEVLADRKLARIETAFTELGHIDAGHRGVLDLTNPRAVVGK
ncbi:MAG: hypothetical protein HKO59_04930 [Phycisphaerales bacterium]|nr:hypothetical protein [Phycisphaerae bacterium]NNF43474.1 hypothetical protein [Phycisphaerales bacterium]NNM25319.1 hypothetical protein [Phycisphaerales bacterium]